MLFIHWELSDNGIILLHMTNRTFASMYCMSMQHIFKNMNIFAKPKQTP